MGRIPAVDKRIPLLVSSITEIPVRRHVDLQDIGPDDHHPKIHSTDHLPGGVDQLYDQSLNTTNSPRFASTSIGYAELDALTADPPLAEGRIWFRRDLPAIRYSPDGTTVLPIDVGGHATVIPIDHPDRSVTRIKLEYPTEDVSFVYLAAINKINFDIVTGVTFISASLIVTMDAFSDKAVKWQGVDVTAVHVRFTDPSNTYFQFLDSAEATADHLFRVTSAGVTTTLGSEAIDIPSNSRQLLKCSASGSSFLCYRNDMITAVISVTDTTFASGAFGIRPTTLGGSRGAAEITSILLAPSSPTPQPSAIIEYPITGAGTLEDPFRPDIPEELVEVSEAEVTPEEWQALQANPKGPTGLPLVNKMAVSWGSIDYKGEPTMICALYGSSPSYIYSDVIKRHVDDARAKGRYIQEAPFTVDKCTAIHGELKGKRPEMLITVNELIYHLTGREEFYPDAMADFYIREVIDMKRIDPDKIPDYDRRIDELIKLARRYGRVEAEGKLMRCKRG